MSEVNENHIPYSDDETERLEIIWGEGFLSPGGPAEVTRMLGGHEITGCNVLDIGSGTGGVDILLVKEHGAESVTGIEVEQKLIDLAKCRLQDIGLENRITYQLVESGPLPFADETFDIVFSKDSIIHIPDKHEVYSEAFRVMRPGGKILVSDWLRGDGNQFDKTVERFIEAAEQDFTLVSLKETGEILAQVGFVEINLEDRRAWYLQEASEELARMRGPLGSQLEEEIEFWEVMVSALGEGAIMPGHIRTMKPAAA